MNSYQKRKQEIDLLKIKTTRLENLCLVVIMEANPVNADALLRLRKIEAEYDTALLSKPPFERIP